MKAPWLWPRIVGKTIYRRCLHAQEYSLANFLRSDCWWVCKRREDGVFEWQLVNSHRPPYRVEPGEVRYGSHRIQLHEPVEVQCGSQRLQC